MTLLWLRAHWKGTAIGLGVLIVGLWVAFCRPQPNPIPPKEQTTIDSMAATKPHFDSTRHSVVDSAQKVVTRIVHDSAAAVRARAQADQYRRIADSALAVARAEHDTTSAAFVAAENATREADQLRATTDTLAHRLSEAKQAIVSLTEQIVRDSVRQHATDDLTARLARDVKTAGQCHILPFVACPSRKVVVVGGVVLGVVAKSVYDQRQRK